MSGLVGTVQKLLAPLRNRVAGMVARAVVSMVKDTPRMQELQLEVFVGEILADAERFQNYGLTSVPLPPTGETAAEAVVLFVGGGRDHPLVIAVDDRRHRLKGLAPGEVSLYDDQGAKVHLLRGQLLVTHPTSVRLERGGAVIETDGSEIRLELGDSSIVIDSSSITITSPTIDLNSS